jgi:phosphonate transport system ATP-binding protein
MTPHADPAETVVSLEGITKRFGDTVALDGASLTVARGEVVVLLGLSGSGKSTLLRHVDGLERPSSGTVRVLGREVTRLTGRALRELRSEVGFIFQQFELVPSLTVLENVLTGSLASVRGPRLGLWSYGRAAKAEALARLERVGLLERAYQRADTLSGGQQQRVAIARALMQRPQVLLADRGRRGPHRDLQPPPGRSRPLVGRSHRRAPSRTRRARHRDRGAVEGAGDGDLRSRRHEHRPA